MQSVVCLLATHVRAVGGIHSNGGQLPPDQALLTYRLWGGHPLQCGAATSGSSIPPRTTSSGVRSPGGASYSGVKRPGGYFLRDRSVASKSLMVLNGRFVRKPFAGPDGALSPLWWMSTYLHRCRTTQGSLADSFLLLSQRYMKLGS